MKRAVILLVILLAILTGCKDKPTPTVAGDGRKTTLPVAVSTPDPNTVTLGVVGLAGWVRYEVVPQSQAQAIGGFVTLDDCAFHGADLIVCIDSACVPVIADQDGALAVTFAGGWSLGSHQWRIEYVGRTPGVVLTGYFTAIEDGE